ncbi:hypothetical protein QVD17_35611 [Tagetes erecta]|uniref:NADP-dependent oxidoreductase domain-containing protein n=1 Tax=Tagetes erecta TaxID=13708 RepID=A0AAD8JSZ5_TARER|nr:hypothetical protein QVD17_35611 [Tagetes erecta]
MQVQVKYGGGGVNPVGIIKKKIDEVVLWPWQKQKKKKKLKLVGGGLSVSPMGEKLLAWNLHIPIPRLQIERIGLAQLHWSTANYAPLQERTLWNGLVAMYDQVQFSLLSMGESQMEIKSICDSLGIRVIAYSPLALGMLTGKYTPANLPRGASDQIVINWCIGKGTIPIPGMGGGWKLRSGELYELEFAARDSPAKMIQNVFQTT